MSKYLCNLRIIGTHGKTALTIRTDGKSFRVVLFMDASAFFVSAEEQSRDLGSLSHELVNNPCNSS